MVKFWNSTKQWLPGVILSLLAIVILIYKVDLRSLAVALQSANYWLLLIGLGISVIWLGVRGLAWRVLLRNKASYRDVFLTVSEGYLLNNFLPARLGEIGRAFLLGRKAGLDFLEVLSTIAVERILDLIFLAVLLLSSIPFIVGAESAASIALLAGGLLVAGLVVLYLLARNREWSLGLFDRLTSRWPRLQTQGKKWVASFLTGLGSLTNGWLFVRALVWLSLDWAISIFQTYLLLLAFFPHPQLIWAVFGLGAAAIGNAIPSLPGAIGTYDAALAGALTLVSHDPATSLAATLVAHLFNYIVTGVIGIYALSREGETLMGVYRQLRHRQVRENEEGS